MSIQEETVHTQNKIEVKDVCFDYVDKKSSFAALDHINLSIKEGEFICILGSSGCGKSTLLGLLNGLNKAKSGTGSCGCFPAVFAFSVADRKGKYPVWH